MAKQKFLDYLEQIANGSADSCEIQKATPCELTALEKQVLMQAFADAKVAELKPTTVTQELKGEATNTTLEVPAFLSGQIKFYDSNNSQQINFAGATESASDQDSDTFTENVGEAVWFPIIGKHYKARNIQIPAGVHAVYNFTLT